MGRENFSEEGGSPPRFSLPSPNPTPLFSKNFVLIESLFAGLFEAQVLF
ncbi:hypothetical protein WCP94_004333 [Bilophila wadsworthia]